MPVIGTMPNTKNISKLNPIIVLRIIQVLIVLVIAGGVYGITIITTEYKDLQKLTDTLGNTSIYKDAQNIARASISSNNSDQKNQKMKELTQKETLADVVAMNKDIENLNAKTQSYLDSIQMPYTNFLHLFLMPSLNIWKNRFTGKIDDSLVGQKYLQENDYLDVNLISKRTDFFKDIGRDSPKNDIKSVTIGEVAENTKNGSFSLIVNVDFVAQTKRSFLLLVDKLSTTSNKENLGLMNEFFFNLWLILKEREYGTTAASGGVLLTSLTGDQQLGTDIYKWVVDDKNTFIKESDIIKAMQRFANCESADMNICYFKFRQKIRNLPSLAYTLGLPTTNKVTELRLFLKGLPPLTNIQSFTFKRMSTTSTRDGDRGYEGNLSIEVYGKMMTQAEVDEIGLYLGSVCLGESAILTPSLAINQVERTIKQSAQIGGFSNERSKQFNDLRQIMQKIEGDYQTATGMKKVVKLFELYRMLIDNKLCTTKN